MLFAFQWELLLVLKISTALDISIETCGASLFLSLSSSNASQPDSGIFYFFSLKLKAETFLWRIHIFVTL